MPERKTLNEDLLYRGSSANLPHLHTCENKVPFWDFSQFAVTKSWMRLNAFSHSTNTLGKGMNPIILPPAMGK